MKHLFIVRVATAIVAMGSSALAADMAPRAVAPVPVAPLAVAAYDWSGIYIGGLIGGGWNRNEISDPGFGILGTLIGVPVIQTTDSSGFIGGVEGGDRYQFGKLVIGWEADMTWGGINGTSTSSFGSPLLPAGFLSRSITANTTWSGTAVSTVGIAHDRWLIYGKAGVAWAHTNYADNWAVAGFPLFSGTGDETRTGWTVGTGVEWGLWNNWSVKVEYDYLEFGNHNVATSMFGIQNSDHINEVKAGLNWKIFPNMW
jgi:outer membrane immunogenic protein